MTSRERMCKAIQREMPDRVPTFEYAIDQKVAQRLCPGGEYADVVEELDLDAITAWEPSMGGYAKGLKARTPGELFVDEWGVTRKATVEMSAFPVEEGAPVGSLSELANYCPPDPSRPHRYAILQEYVKRFKGSKLITYNIVDMFETTKCLLGFQNFLLSVSQDRELLTGAYAVVTDWIIDVAKKSRGPGRGNDHHKWRPWIQDGDFHRPAHPDRDPHSAPESRGTSHQGPQGICVLPLSRKYLADLGSDCEHRRGCHPSPGAGRSDGHQHCKEDFRLSCGFRGEHKHGSAVPGQPGRGSKNDAQDNRRNRSRGRIHSDGSCVYPLRGQA